jgi:hypothetical protein
MHRRDLAVGVHQVARCGRCCVETGALSAPPGTESREASVLRPIRYVKRNETCNLDATRRELCWGLAASRCRAVQRRVACIPGEGGRDEGLPASPQIMRPIFFARLHMRLEHAWAPAYQRRDDGRWRQEGAWHCACRVMANPRISTRSLSGSVPLETLACPPPSQHPTSLLEWTRPRMWCGPIPA